MLLYIYISVRQTPSKRAFVDNDITRYDVPTPMRPQHASTTSRAENRSGEKNLLWRCGVCGELGSLDSVPPSCPSCGAPGEEIGYVDED